MTKIIPGVMPPQAPEKIPEMEKRRRAIADRYVADNVALDAFEGLQQLAMLYPQNGPILYDFMVIALICAEYTIARNTAIKLLELLPESLHVVDKATEILSSVGEEELVRQAWLRIANTQDRDCAYTALAGGAIRHNKMQEAKDWIRQALQESRTNPMTLLIGGQIARKTGDFTEAEQLLADCSKPDVLPIVRFRALYEMGELYDQLGEPVAAVKAWRTAKQCLETEFADRVAQSRQLRQKRLARNRQLLEELADSPCRSWRQLRPSAAQPSMAILAGHPRSGTTLLEQMIAAHPQVADLDEKEALSAAFKATLMRNVPEYPNLNHLKTASPLQLAGIRSEYLRRVAMLLGRLPRNALLLDKNPNFTDVLPLLLPVFPGIRLLVARRDPKDILLSCFRLAVTPEAANVAWLREADAVEDYRSMMAVWERLRDLLDVHDGWMEVSYEALCDAPETLGRQVTEFLGLEWHPDQDRYREVRAHAHIASPTHAEVRAPVSRNAIGRWRRYADLLPELFESFG